MSVLEDQIRKLQQEKAILEFVKEYIEKNCVYDEHLQGYCFDLPKGKVRTLMNHIEEESKKVR